MKRKGMSDAFPPSRRRWKTEVILLLGFFLSSLAPVRGEMGEGRTSPAPVQEQPAPPDTADDGWISPGEPESKSKRDGETVGRAREESSKIFASLLVAFRTFRGDKFFDGQGFLSDGQETIFLPKPDAGSGLGLAVGGRGFSDHRVSFGAEVYAAQSAHESSWRGSPFDVLFLSLGGRLLVYIPTGRSFQPYAGIGFSRNFLSIENGAVKGTRKESALLAGYGLSLSAGLEKRLNRRFSAVLDGTYDFGYFSVASGVDLEDVKISENLRYHGFFPSARLVFYF
jgi:hypothetical protein